MLAAAALVLIALGLWATLTLPDREPGDGSRRDLAAVDESGTRKDATVTPTEGDAVYEAVRVAPGEGLLDVEQPTGRLIDHAVPAAYLPAVSGPSQGTYLEESQLITVFDRVENRLYLFELKHARAVIQPARIDM